MKIKRISVTLAALFLAASTIMAQSLIQYPAPSLELKIEQSGGKNGAAVAFNTTQKLYYCVMAGNATFPLETFDIYGNNVNQADAYNDMRGMWWNAKAKALEGNCYNDGGIVNIGLMDNGYAGTGNSVIFAGGNHQPGEHACGVMDPKKKEILYYQDGKVMGYSRKDGTPTGTNIYLDLPVGQDNINWSSMIFTGKKKMEIGVLDHSSKKVYLFDRKSGNLTGTVNFPSGTKVESGFNFGFANNYVFLFDQGNRKWIGYKIF